MSRSCRSVDRVEDMLNKRINPMRTIRDQGGIAVGLAVLSLGLALGAGAAVAQTPAPAPAKTDGFYADPAHANIAGFWRPAPGPRAVFKVGNKVLPPPDAHGHLMGFPYKPAWKKAVDARYAADLKGEPYGDPNDSCWPPGIFGDYLVDPNGIDVVETPGRVEMDFERQSSVRWIYTDGRGHPTGDDLIPTVKGDSIGHWDGDTLVVDTIGVRGEPTLGYRLPHSDQVHFVERFKRVDPDTLQIDVTITDPQAFTQPVNATLTYKRADIDTIAEQLCLEKNMDKRVDANLVVHPDPRVKKHYGFDLPNPH